jgi:hypothetical protein
MGADFCSSVAGICFTTESTLDVTIANVREVSIKATAAIVVSLLRNVAAPLLPKIV